MFKQVFLKDTNVELLEIFLPKSHQGFENSSLILMLEWVRQFSWKFYVQSLQALLEK